LAPISQDIERPSSICSELTASEGKSHLIWPRVTPPRCVALRMRFVTAALG
jgi:hypothetical protein